MPTVYVTQHAQRKRKDPDTGAERWEKIDLAPAGQFGTVEVLLPAGPMILATAHASATLRQKLRSFTDEDFLLCMGDPTLIGLACVHAARANQGRYKVLVWDRHRKDYTAVSVDANSNPSATDEDPHV